MSVLLIFPQDEHERLLLGRLKYAGIHVERNTEFVAFEQSEDGVRATLRTAGASPETCTARYLAGCDGAHSTGNFISSWMSPTICSRCFP